MRTPSDVIIAFVLGMIGLAFGFYLGTEWQKQQTPQLQLELPGLRLEQHKR